MEEKKGGSDRGRKKNGGNRRRDRQRWKGQEGENEKGGKQIEIEREQVERERQLKSVSWMSYEMQIANQLHSSILFITFMIKSCGDSFSFPSLCSYLLSVCSPAIFEPVSSPNVYSSTQTKTNTDHNTSWRWDSSNIRNPCSYCCDTCLPAAFHWRYSNIVWCRQIREMLAMWSLWNAVWAPTAPMQWKSTHS